MLLPTRRIGRTDLRFRRPNLRWIKSLILPAARTHTSRKITAVALITGSVSVFRFVQPVDEAASLFRMLAMIAGTAGFIGLLWLFVFFARLWEAIV